MKAALYLIAAIGALALVAWLLRRDRGNVGALAPTVSTQTTILPAQSNLAASPAGVVPSVYATTRTRTRPPARPAPVPDYWPSDPNPNRNG